MQSFRHIGNTHPHTAAADCNTRAELTPTPTLPPTATTDACTDPGNIIYLRQALNIRLQMGSLTDRMNNNDITLEEIQQTLQDMLDAQQKLTAPPYWRDYQDNEVKFLQYEILRLDAAIRKDQASYDLFSQQATLYANLSDQAWVNAVKPCLPDSQQPNS